MTHTEFASPAPPVISDPAPWCRDFANADRRDVSDTFDYLLARGTVGVALPQRSPHWTPEKRLAGAILASALVEIRDHYGDRGHRRRVIENLDWVESDDCEWPFSFVRLCQLFDLEPSWVRAIVRRWVSSREPELWRDAMTLTGLSAAIPARRTVHAAIA